MSSDHMKYLSTISDEDVRFLHEREQTYQGSWKKRGGVGAFMMLARKWDRIENMLNNYDIFKAIADNPSGDDSTVLAEIRDLRRYLLLVEAEMVARGSVKYNYVHEEDRYLPGTPEDGGHHARQPVE